MVSKRQVFAGLVLLCVVSPGTRAYAQSVSDPVADVLAALPNALPTAPIAFVGITPCRLADTRGNGFIGAFGPPSMAAQTPRVFPVAGNCGIPLTAQAVSANLAVTNTSGLGFISVWPGGAPQPNPLVASMNYSAGQTIANAVLAPLGTNGGITVYARVGLDLIIDVNGYFDTAPRAAPACFDNANRYVNCGNGTVTDTATGLIWLKNANCFSTMTYSAANQAAAGLAAGQCGLTDGSSAGDWRLPTKAEWEATIARAVALGCTASAGAPPSLTNDAGTGCLIPGPTSFTGVQSGPYWSSSAHEGFPVSAWYVSLNNGNVGFDPKVEDFFVWPVRGEQ